MEIVIGDSWQVLSSVCTTQHLLCSKSVCSICISFYAACLQTTSLEEEVDLIRAYRHRLQKQFWEMRHHFFLVSSEFTKRSVFQTCSEEPDPTADSPSLLLFPFFAWSSVQNKIRTLLSTKHSILKPTQRNCWSCTLRSLDLYQCWHLWAIFRKAALIFNDMQWWVLRIRSKQPENNEKGLFKTLMLIS